ncbi:MAG TPA: hypothetical protein VGE07_01785, partial [Herpetosiphonaceae bacterium]
EAAPVTAFDVSRDTGRLAYVSGGDLIVADADGGNRGVVLASATIDPSVYHAADLTITNPLWAPGGETIAFSLGGVQLVPASGGEPSMLLANEPPTIDIAPFSVMYQPALWSPDGSKLLLNYAFYPEGGGLAALDMVERSVVRADASKGITCCEPVWSPDGGAYYYAFDTAAITRAGLWAADSDTGAETTILGSDAAEGPWVMARAPLALADGSLRAFVGLTDDLDVIFGSEPRTLQLASVNPLTGDVTPLRSDSINLLSALWAPDGSGAVVTSAPYAEGDMALAWLPAADLPLASLPLAGRSPRWGAR